MSYWRSALILLLVGTLASRSVRAQETVVAIRDVTVISATGAPALAGASAASQLLVPLRPQDAEQALTTQPAGASKPANPSTHSPPIVRRRNRLLKMISR